MTQIQYKSEISSDNKVSLLYLLTAETGKVENRHNGGINIIIPKDANIIVFSDRPHRIAKHVPGGVASFADFFSHSDLMTDPPNITFAGNFNVDETEKYSVLELVNPFVKDDFFVMPINTAIGDEKLLPEGEYENISIVIDNVWGWIGAIGAAIGTVGAGAGTIAACTVGEVATAGLDTGVCVAGVVGTIGAATGTVGAFGAAASS